MVEKKIRYAWYGFLVSGQIISHTIKLLYGFMNFHNQEINGQNFKYWVCELKMCETFGIFWTFWTERTVKYVLFKIFAIASHYTFPSFWLWMIPYQKNDWKLNSTWKKLFKWVISRFCRPEAIKFDLWWLYSGERKSFNQNSVFFTFTKFGTMFFL